MSIITRKTFDTEVPYGRSRAIAYFMILALVSTLFIAGLSMGGIGTVSTEATDVRMDQVTSSDLCMVTILEPMTQLMVWDGVLYSDYAITTGGTASISFRIVSDIELGRRIIPEGSIPDSVACSIDIPFSYTGGIGTVDLGGPMCGLGEVGLECTAVYSVRGNDSDVPDAEIPLVWKIRLTSLESIRTRI